MKINLFIFGIILFHLQAHAQYYFNDLLNTQTNKKHFEKLQQYQIKKVTVKALEADGSEIEDFLASQEIDIKKKNLVTYSKTNISDGSILETSFNEFNMPVSVLDSSEGASSRTTYKYDEKGRLTTMESISVQAEQYENIVNEIRLYEYAENNVPIQMLRIKGKSDTMYVKFIATENGMPGEEEWWKAGKKIETWFYYYDSDNRLTDIVRFNNAAKKMLPDYLFGYDENNNLTSRITVQPVTGSFRIWQFRYDARGLKIEETVMNRQRQPEGKLVFTYQ
jgi:YD repeat-containing protein